MGSLEPNTKSWVIESPNFLTGCLLGLYLFFILYASLYPGYPLRLPNDPILSLITVGWIDKTYQFDIFQNFLFYMPLGALWIYRFPSLLLTTFTLSTLLELIQSYIPIRTPSILDVGLNVSGAILAYMIWNDLTRGIIKKLHAATHSRHTIKNALGISILLLFIFVQWAPFIPTLEPSHIRRSLNPILMSLTDPSTLKLFAIAKYTSWGLATYFGLKLVFKLEHDLLGWLVFISFVFFIKLFIITRVLSLEAVLGILTCYLLIIFLKVYYLKQL